MKNKCLKKLLLLSTLVFFAAGVVAGQQPLSKANQATPSRNISGTVINSSGSPLDGVSITAKNAGTGTSTNANGYFKIIANPNDVLVISSVGYIEQEIKIDNQENIKITLEDDQKKLDEVVVVGYG
ncbi:MAG: carboxypeptidase-like regulatory domain-containing protein, partial [Segetibacter sp.]